MQQLLARCYAGGNDPKTDELIKNFTPDTKVPNESNEINGSPFHIKYMHSEQSLFNYLSKDEVIDQLINQLKEHNIVAKHKIYGVGLHIHSRYSLCENACETTIFGFQNSQKDRVGFLNLLRYKLQAFGYYLPIRKSILPMFTTFSYSLECPSNAVSESIQYEKKPTNVNCDGPNRYLLFYNRTSASKKSKPDNDLIQLSKNNITFFMSGSGSPQKRNDKLELAYLNGDDSQVINKKIKTENSK